MLVFIRHQFRTLKARKRMVIWCQIVGGRIVGVRGGLAGGLPAPFDRPLADLRACSGAKLNVFSCVPAVFPCFPNEINELAHLEHKNTGTQKWSLETGFHFIRLGRGLRLGCLG